MGNDEAATPKTEKASLPVQEQPNVHAYPDWATMQAYYGPGVALPPAYFNSAVASGHAPPPYMWGPPQPLMPPYGAPYAAIYSHGGVYAHPSVPFGSHGNGIPPSPIVSEVMVATPLSVEPPAKSSSSKDQGLMKKLKGFGGLSVSISNGSAENGAAHALSQSEDCGTEGSSDGSNGNTAGENKTPGKRSCEGTPSAGLELKGSPGAKPKTNTATVPPAPGMLVPAHDRIPANLRKQDERELKREKRKQSNRESARRSRLRKQAETEELALKVDALNVENMALRSELNQLTENSKKLRLENAALMEKLKNAQLGQAGEVISNNIESQVAPPDSTENLLSRVNNSGSVRSEQGDSEAQENSGSSTKLHQLLESSPRADAVPAG